MAKTRPLTSAQREQHRAFLRQLARTGNAMAAAAASGISLRTLNARRARHAAFAQDWARTLAAADARLHQAGGARPGRRDGETTISLRKDGRLQVRRARADAVTRAGEQRFLLALSATANISLAAAAAGASPAAFTKRRRANPAFAREMRAALAQGYENLETALLESWSPASGDDDQWRRNDTPALPPMTPGQALHLMNLHRGEVRWRETSFAERLLPGETSDLRSTRLARRHRAKQIADAEAAVERELARMEARLERLAPEPIVLPDLAQVKGWSKAKGDAGEPLFDGRINQRLTDEQRAKGRRKAQEARRGGGGRKR